jgi:hypothetical protein
MSEFMPETTPVYAQENRVREDQNPRHLWRGNFKLIPIGKKTISY